MKRVRMDSPTDVSPWRLYPGIAMVEQSGQLSWGSSS